MENKSGYTKFDKLKKAQRLRIDNSCFLKNWLLTWTNDIKEIVLESEKHSRISFPKKLNISFNEHYLESLYNRMSLEDSLHIFTLNRSIWPLTGIFFCKIIEFGQSFAIFKILEIWDDQTINKNDFDILLKYYLTGILAAEFFKGFFFNLFNFRLEKVGISLRGALTGLLHSKLLRKNFDNDTKIVKEDFNEIIGTMASLYKDYPKYISYMMQVWIQVIGCYALGAYFFDPIKFSIGISIFNLIFLMSYFILKKILKKSRGNYERAKFERKDTVLEVIKNMFMIKCNAQEDFFKVKVSNLRKKEMKNFNKVKLVERIYFFVIGVISFTVLTSIVFYFQGKISDGKLAIGYAVFARISLLTILLILNLFVAKKTNFERVRGVKFIEFFMKSKEVESWPGMYDQIDDYNLQEIREVEEKFIEEKKSIKGDGKKKKRKATGFAVSSNSENEVDEKPRRKRKATGFLKIEDLGDVLKEVEEENDQEKLKENYNEEEEKSLGQDGKINIKGEEQMSVKERLKLINQQFQADYGQKNYEHGEYVITSESCFFYWEKNLHEYNKNFKNFYSEEEYNYTILKQKEYIKSSKAISNKSSFRRNKLTLGDSSIEGIRAEELGINLEKYQLKDISLKILKGKFYYILGSENSGSQFLLKALAGKMSLETLNGPEIKMKGDVYYMDNNPWLINGTIKENIILGRNYDFKKFQKAIELSGLSIDISEKAKGVMFYCGAQSDSLNPLFKLKIEVARVIYSE